MTLLNRRTRSAAAIAAAAAIVPFAATTASAAPLRSATTSHYSHADFTQHALGLSASVALTIEPVTYDRFQWLLQQTGKFAFLIGDPATDATFKARAEDVAAAAAAAGVKKVYWFDPNLSGNAQVGTVTEPNLDIRKPSGITSLSSASQTVYGNAWLALVGQYLGDGVTVTITDLGEESSKVTAAATGTATVNDAGSTAGASTEVGHPSGGALYDYSGGSAPTDVQDSYFLIYDKDHTATGGQPQKIVSWVDLSAAASSATAKADVTTAIGTVGGGNVAQLDQFAWWKSAVNFRQATQGEQKTQGVDHPPLSDADNAAVDGGWRIEQLTYPELVDLLKTENSAEATILFGGTWCPNTRPVLPFVNKYAQQNDVPVYNFDTVLDGGLVGGGTTSATNPLQSRNTVGKTGAASTTQDNPSFLYGDLVARYLKNIKTQYDPTKTFVSYYPNADASSGTPTKINKLQVPFLIGYQGSGDTAPTDGVKRQWIIDKGDGTFTEYMSQWWYTNPQPNELGLGANLPLDAAAWTGVNAKLATFKWDTDPATVIPNTGTDADDGDYLGAADTATITYTAAAGANPSSVSAAGGGASPISISPAALSAAYNALANKPAKLADAKTAYLALRDGGTPASDTTVSNLATVIGAWTVAQQRKTKLITTWGSPTAPGSISGGLNAVHAIDRFFAEKPGPVATPTPTPTPTATPTPTPAPTAAPAPGAAATPSPQPTAKPLAAATKIAAAKLAGTVAKAPTSKKPGKYKVRATAASGHAAATGFVTITLSKGKTKKTLTSTLANGALTVTVPKLAKGTWKVTISWAGDGNYLAAKVSGTAIKVKK